MADNKKYYYLKLKDNFFDSDSMIVLESMENGYLYSNILMKMYLRSLKNEGKLLLNDKIPYNTQMLSKILRHNVDIVEKAIKVFKQLELIDILDNGAIYISDIQNFIGESSTEADRIRSYRNKIDFEKAIAIDCTNVVQMYNKNTPEIEIEDRQIDNINIYIINQLKKIDLVQNQTSKYNQILKSKEVYVDNIEFLSKNLILQYKLYQNAVVSIYKSKQCNIFENLNLNILEKVYGQIIQIDGIEDVLNYYKTAVINEVIKRGEYS